MIKSIFTAVSFCSPTKAVSETVKLVVAAAWKLWVGSWRVELPPSPKSQFQPVVVAPVVLSVKATWSGLMPFVGVALKSGTKVAGVTVIRSVCVSTSCCRPMKPVSETLYVPGAVYVCDGCWRFELLPSPKCHVY